ncbi:MAG: hypothetical protein H6Q99_3133 [Proteobacteria bacterium]|nr:hypothetical protein [Pseudomonadota bacterium]
MGRPRAMVRGCVPHYALDEGGKVDYSEATLKPA